MKTRISLRAVVSGVFVTFSVMLFSMLLAGGVGVWNFDISRIPLLGTSFWLWAFISWPVSLYAAGYLSSMVSRSSTQLDGTIHGVVVWAASCFFASTYFLYFAGNLLEDIPDQAVSPILWGFMVADLTAFGAALAGGVNGALSEFKIELLEDSKKETASGARLDQAAAPT